MTPGPMRSGYAADRRGPMTRMGTNRTARERAGHHTDVTRIHPEVSDMAKKDKQERHGAEVQASSPAVAGREAGAGRPRR